MSGLNILSAIMLDLAAVIFAMVYIWLNTFSKIVDVWSRNEVIVRVVKITMILSILFAFLTCVVADEETFPDSVMDTHNLYIFIGLSWIVVLVCLAIAAIFRLVSKERFLDKKTGTLNRILKIAICGAVLSLGMAWLI